MAPAASGRSVGRQRAEGAADNAEMGVVKHRCYRMVFGSRVSFMSGFSCLVLQVHAHADHRHWTAVAVVGGIVDKLVIQA